MAFPYRYLVELYFPRAQWDRAECISVNECSPDRQGYPQSCVGDEGLISCNPATLPYLQSYSYGPMQILDACWSPARNPASPFTAEQWARVMDPNVNFWMASVIWSRNGWGAWTTCGDCDVCDVPGGPIPYPNGPVEPQRRPMTVTAESDIQIQTVRAEAAQVKLQGTPLQAYTSLFVQFALQYAIDLNWVLSYLQWENGFGTAGGTHFSVEHKNPWDILCLPYDPPACGTYPPQNWGAVGCNDPGNGYCYAVYPSMAVGIEAGYRLWRSYVERGWTTWFKSLSVALCGNPDGCEGQWVSNVIATGADNARRWPPIPPVPPPAPVSNGGLILGGVIMAAGVGLLLSQRRVK